MNHNVFIVSAQADQAVIDILVRRLRALKFKVRFDKSRNHTTPTPKDIRDANDAGTVLVAWSEAACDVASADSDWVHAMAHQARSRDGALVEVNLDGTKPDAPFTRDPKLSLAGLTARKNVAGLAELIRRLETRTGRSGLNEWLALKPKDTAARAVWKARYPDDPISRAGRPVRAEKPIQRSPGQPLNAAPPLNLKAPEQPEIDVAQDHLITGSIMLGILAMFAVAYFVRAEPMPEPTDRASAIPQYIFTCPNGERIMCPAETLGPTGPIIDDTE